MINLDDLEAKAKAAINAYRGAGDLDYDEGRNELKAGGLLVADIWDDAFGCFIAAANPAIVLALIRELREKRVLCERLAERAATAEKWRSLASGKNGDGRTVQEIQREAVAAEREACADLVQGWNTAMTDKLAAEIRARGEKRGEPDQAIAYTHGDNQDHNGRDVTLLWNPLADDGDAFRLAVKLHICTLFPMAGDRFAQCGAGQVGGDSAACMEPHSPDPCAATRRAIVRAAAEIGRAMP